MARAIKKFSAGGAQGRYDRRMADIEKDRKIALAKGKNADVAEAKAAQRIADAKDDLAKRTGADRTATRKAEYEAEQRLSRTRKFGADKPAAAAEPAKTTAPAATAAPVAEKAKPQSFGAAFKAERARLGAGKTFTFNGKSYSTNIAGEGRKASGSRTNNSAGASSSSTNTGAAAAAAAAAAKAKRDADAKAAADKAKRDAAATTAKDAKAKRDAATTATTVTGPSTTKTPINAGRSPGILAGFNPFKGLRLTNEADMKAYYARAAAEAKKAKEARNLAKGGSVKKEKTMKYRSGGSTSKPPQPTPAERKAAEKFRESLKKEKVTPENAAAIGRGNRSPGMAKGGKAKAKSFAATKFGAAMKKKSADTKGRAMPKFAKGGSIDGCATKGKTKGSMIAMAMGGKTKGCK